ncbi:MAG: hypothetical protein ACYDH5_07260 [Acidimicrobiales bacterium]
MSTAASTRHRPGSIVHWKGPVRRYDIVKEASIAMLVVLALSVLLAVLFSSPDTPPVTIEAWATAQPVRFTEIALSELEGTSDSARYGPPYNNGSEEVQRLGPVSIQRLLGVHYPLDPANAFVIRPLQALPETAALNSALSAYKAAAPATRLAWERAYGSVLPHASFAHDQLSVPAGSYGPIGELLGSLLAMARSGGLDAQLISHSFFYTTDYTKPIMFLGDSWKAQRASSYWGKTVVAQHLRTSQWGVMNETGSWPGQPWLWLYTFWYQVPGLSGTHNVDVDAIAIMTALSLLLVAVPFVPGIRDLPRWVPLHHLIWRDYYREVARRPGVTDVGGPGNEGGREP